MKAIDPPGYAEKGELKSLGFVSAVCNVENPSDSRPCTVRVGDAARVGHVEVSVSSEQE